MSNKREKILFSLKCGPMSLTQINEMLGVKSPESLPQLTRMVDSNLIYRDDNRVYHLTRKGHVLVNVYQPLYDTIQVFERFDGFFDTHDISAIPDELFDRLQELKDCNLIESEEYNICESHPEFLEGVINSLCFKGVACIFRSSWISLFLGLANHGVPIEIIITEGIYNKIKQEYPNELEEGLKNKKAHIYICEDLKVSFSTTDQFFSLSLNFAVNGSHDTKSDIIGVDSAAIRWGKDLFKYYKEKAVEVPKTLPENIHQLTINNTT